MVTEREGERERKSYYEGHGGNRGGGGVWDGNNGTVCRAISAVAIRKRTTIIML